VELKSGKKMSKIDSYITIFTILNLFWTALLQSKT